MTPLVISVVAYLVVTIAIGLYAAKFVTNSKDYLVAGRGLPLYMNMATVFATWFGAETCIGAAGEAYKHGLSGVISDPFGYTAGLVLTGLFFAAALWKSGLLTLADLFHKRYSAGVERFASLIMVPSSVMWAAAQIRAFGQVLQSVSEFNLFFAITFAAAVVIAYTVTGGMWANAVTDLVQGIVMVTGLGIMGYVFIADGGLAQIAALPAERFNFMHERGVWDALNTLAVPIFSTIAAQELAARVLSSRSAAIAGRATVAAGFSYLAVGIVPVMIGLGAVAYIGEGANEEQVLSLFARTQLSMPLYILFLGALVSAILSTMDSALLAAAALVEHNVIVPLKPDLSERAKVRIARVGVLVFGIIAYVLALHAEGIYALVQQSSAFGGGGVFTIVMFGLFTRVGGARAAAAALIVGVVAWLAGEHAFGWSTPYLISLFAATLAYLAAAAFDHFPVRIPRST